MIERRKRKSSPHAVALRCQSDVPFSAAMIRLHRNTSPSLSLSHTHTHTHTHTLFSHFNIHTFTSLTHSPRHGLSPAFARVSLRSPWRPFPGWFTIAPGPSQGGTLVCSPQSLPGHQWSHPCAPLTLPPPRLSSWTWFTPVFCPLAARHLPLSVTVYPPQ